jgi:erythromycin esterase
MIATSSSPRNPAADAILEVAVPLGGIKGFPDPTPIVEFVGSSSVIGFGEPTHGDAESLRLKHDFMRAIARNRNHTLIAWERGVGNIRHIARFLAADQEIPHESRCWMYPWVYQEVDDVLHWVREANRVRAGTVSLCGIDMDGPPPTVVLDELEPAVGALGSGPLGSIRRQIIESGRFPEDPDRYHAVLAAVAELQMAVKTLARPDWILLEATAQWARHRLLKLSEPNASSAGDRAPSAEHRDGCMAVNLLAHRCDNRPDVIVLSAHNAHVSLDEHMAGWHLARALGLEYVSVGVAFGGGSFTAEAASHGVGSHPQLTVFDAEPPPEGTLEWLLSQVGLSSFVVDLRPFRGTDHPLAHEMLAREAGLMGAAPQFDMYCQPAATYDLLVWIDSVTPANVLRNDGDRW